MTLVHEPVRTVLARPRPAPAPTPRRARPGWSSLAADAAVVATLAWWATGLTWGTGGREPRVLAVGAALLLLAVALVRPWERAPRAATVLVLALGAAAWGVVLLAPSGTAGVDEAAAHGYAAVLGLLAWAWATTALRRGLLLATLLAAAGLQLSQGWLAFWGRQDPTALFQGTFYWHNQAGIFLAAGAVLALATAAHGHRPWALLGWAVAPLAVAGTVWSTSRGSQIGLALGVLLLLVAVVLGPRGTRLRRGARLAAAATLSWGVTVALSGPPFFPERVSPTAGTEERAGSFVGNGVQRLEDWRRAWEVFLDRPLVGSGPNGFDSAVEAATTKRDAVDTAYAHNGYLQALSDGGLLLTLPLLLLLGATCLAVARALPRAVRSGDLVHAGAAATLLVLLLHSGMDFDWAYPSLLALTALVAALALPPAAGAAKGRRRAPAATDRRTTWLLAAGTLAVVALAVVGGWGHGLDLNVAV